MIRGAGGKAESGNDPLRRIACISLIVLPLLSFLSCLPQQASVTQPDEVKLQLKWQHQAQFAGFYVAQEKGYYKDEDINVTFIEGGQNIDIAQRVALGEADFGVVTPEFLFLKHGEGMNLTALAAIFRRSATVYVAKTGSGIVRPGDFTGRTVAASDMGWGQKDFEVQFYAMIKKLGLDISKIKVIQYDPAYTGFHNGAVDVTAAYYTGGVVSMRRQGYDLNLIWPGDYGIRFYSDTIVTSGRLIAENPGLVSRFLRASLRGWNDAIYDYRDAVDITMKYARGRDVSFQTAMMEAMLPLINTGEDYVGWMKPEEWQAMYEIMDEAGMPGMPFDVREIYTTDFLEEIYRSKTK